MKALRLPKKSNRHSICFIIVILSFIPLQLGSYSANFFYLSLFFVCPIAALDKVPAYTTLAIIIPSVSLLVGFISALDADIDFLRSFISYGAYISILAILFLRVPLSSDDVYRALLAICIVYSALCIYFVITEPQFALSDIRGIKSGLRDLLGDWPQRFPQLIVVSLLYLVFKPNFHPKRIISIALLLACVIFTYTRAIYLAFFVGMAVGFLPQVLRFKLKKIRAGAYLLFCVCGVTAIGFYFEYEVLGSLYDGAVRISSEAYEAIARFFSGGFVADRHGGSESERLYHWVEALAIWQEHPIFGTGFAGIYQYSNMGSTHSQYVDTLLRIGIFGLAIYLYLWALLFRRYWKRPEIFSGLAAIFIYGFFHESTKLVYTGLLFVLLLSCSKQPQQFYPKGSV